MNICLVQWDVDAYRHKQFGLMGAYCQRAPWRLSAQLTVSPGDKNSVGAGAVLMKVT